MYLLFYFYLEKLIHSDFIKLLCMPQQNNYLKIKSKFREIYFDNGMKSIVPD